jgi:DNA processing protein
VKRQTQVLVPGDPDYPAALVDLGSKSPLYLRGTLPKGPAIAIVGKREASEEALAFTRDVVSALAEKKVSIWSGGARGVDAAAHRGALDAGVPTVVVFGGGLDRIYPEEHADLFDEIVDKGGACLARVADHVAPGRPGFLARNALLAAMTSATLVVEAGVPSGAKSTAAAARRFQRRLMIVPGSPWDPRGVGCALELVRGAYAVASPDDVLRVLGLSRSRAAARACTPTRALAITRPRVRRDPCDGPNAESPLGRGDRGVSRQPMPLVGPLSPDEATVLQVLDREAVHLDLVVERAGLPADRATAALLTLTIKAVVVEGPAGSYRRASSSLCPSLFPEK